MRTRKLLPNLATPRRSSAVNAVSRLAARNNASLCGTKSCSGMGGEAGAAFNSVRFVDHQIEITHGKQPTSIHNVLSNIIVQI